MGGTLSVTSTAEVVDWVILLAFIDLRVVLRVLDVDHCARTNPCTETISGLRDDVVVEPDAVETAGVMSMPTTMRPSFFGDENKVGSILNVMDETMPRPGNRARHDRERAPFAGTEDHAIFQDVGCGLDAAAPRPRFV